MNVNRIHVVPIPTAPIYRVHTTVPAWTLSLVTMVETALVKRVMNQYIIHAMILMNVKQIHAAHIQTAPTIRDHTTALVCPLSIVNTMREIVLARWDIKSKTVNAKI